MAKKIKVIYRVTVVHQTTESCLVGCFLELEKHTCYFRKLVDARRFVKLYSCLNNTRITLLKVDENGSEEIQL